MTQIRCPECPSDEDPKDSRGMWSHLHHQHGWDKERAKQWVRSQKPGGDDDEPDSGAAAVSHDDENSTERPESESNQGDRGFQFDEEAKDPERSPAEDEVPEPDEEAIIVQEEGSEKLSPDGFDSKNRPEMSAPEGSDLPDDVTPDDLEPTESTRDPIDSGPDRPEREGHPTEDDDGSDDEGILSKLRNRGSDESQSDDEPESPTEEIVEEADDPDERERRQRVLDALNGDTEETEERQETPESQSNQTDTDDTSRESQSDPSPKPAQMQNGMVVDENLLETLFGLPFDQAATVTGWEGWRLSAEEKEANARLLRAWADEQDIDLGPGVMLAMSLGSTVGGRAVGYTRHRRQQSSDDSSTQSDPEPDPDPETRPSETTDRSDSTVPDQTTERDEQDHGTFDFDQPIGQQPAGA